MNVIRKGVEADQKKAVQYEIEGKSAVKYIKKKKLEQELAAKADESSSTVQVAIEFRSQGEPTPLQDLKLELKLADKMNVREVLDLHIMPVLQELKWNTYFIWCGHEPVEKLTEFQDLSYQKSSNGLSFLCVNYERKPEKNEAKIQKFDECVVCMEDNDGKQYLACLHACCCKNCFEMLDKCPICNKRKPA